MTFSSIDPARLRDATVHLQRAAADLHRLTARLRAECAACDVEPGELAALGHIASWADEQQPMLRRRQSLADAISARDGHLSGGGPAAGPVQIPGAYFADEARHLGDLLAGRIDAELSRDGHLSWELLADLHANAADPDCMRAMLDAIGPDRFTELATHAMLSGAPAEVPAVLGAALATYTRSGPVDSAWLRGMTLPESTATQGVAHTSALGYVLAGVPASRLGRQFLEAIGARLVELNFGSYGPVSAPTAAGALAPDAYTPFVALVAADPVVCAHLVRDHAEAIHGFTVSPAIEALPPGSLTALVGILRGATLGVQSADPHLADENTAHLLYLLAADAPHAHAPGEISALYGEILHTHFPALTTSVTSFVPEGLTLRGPGGATILGWDTDAWRSMVAGGRQGVQIPPDIWGAAMEEALRDPDSAVQLSTDFELFDNRVADFRANAQRSNDFVTHIAAWDAGVMIQFYDDHFRATQKDLAVDLQAWVDGVNEATDAQIDNVVRAAAAVVAIPELGAPALAREVAEDTLIGAGRDTLVSKVKAALHVTVGDAPPDLRAAAQRGDETRFHTEWFHDWQRDADLALNSARRGINPITPVTIEYQGKTTRYTADPLDYIGSPEQDFRGHSIDAMTPPQLAAYSRFLRDPALAVQLVRNSFDVTRLAAGG